MIDAGTVATINKIILYIVCLLIDYAVYSLWYYPTVSASVWVPTTESMPYKTNCTNTCLCWGGTCIKCTYLMHVYKIHTLYVYKQFLHSTAIIVNY